MQAALEKDPTNFLEHLAPEQRAVIMVKPSSYANDDYSEKNFYVFKINLNF